MRLNAKQIKILAVGAFLIAAMGCFPPWYQVAYEYNSGAVLRKKDAGYALLIAPPEPATSRFLVELDVMRLIVQWIAVAGLTSGLLVLTRSPSSERRDELEG